MTFKKMKILMLLNHVGLKGTGARDYNCLKVIRLDRPELILPPGVSLVILTVPLIFY